MAVTVVLAWLVATGSAAPARTCAQQAPCLDFTYECTPSGYRICMTIDTSNPSCVVDDTCNTGISHVCLVSPGTSLTAPGARNCVTSGIGCTGNGACGGTVDSQCKLNDATSGNQLCQTVAPGMGLLLCCCRA